MNRTKIEWTDFTWNPVTGCWGPGGTAEKPNRCWYCYAQRMTKRFLWENRLDGSPMKSTPFMEDPFRPTFYPKRLKQPAKVKKPSKIFVCSMADLFGDWVPANWIASVLGQIANAAPWHTYQFLTKNPKCLKDFNPWPSNCWVGTTVTNQADDWRINELLKVDASVRFVSHEPLLSEIDMRPWIGDYMISPGPGQHLNWAIIGAMTGPGAVRPDLAWVLSLERQYQAAGVPIFEKNNLRLPGPKQDIISAGAHLIQEWPV